MQRNYYSDQELVTFLNIFDDSSGYLDQLTASANLPIGMRVAILKSIVDPRAFETEQASSSPPLILDQPSIVPTEDNQQENLESTANLFTTNTMLDFLAQQIEATPCICPQVVLPTTTSTPASAQDKNAPTEPASTAATPTERVLTEVNPRWKKERLWTGSITTFAFKSEEVEEPKKRRRKKPASKTPRP